MVPGDMYEWSRVIFFKKSKFHDAGGPDTVVSPITHSYIIYQPPPVFLIILPTLDYCCITISAAHIWNIGRSAH